MSNPFLQNDPEEDRAYQKMVISSIAGASLVVLLFLALLYVNTNKKNHKNVNISKKQEAESEEDDFVYGESNLVSSDLEFWDMYEEDKTVPEEEDEGEDTPYKKGDGNKDKKDKKKTDKTEEFDGEESDESSKNEADKEDSLEITDDEGNKKYYEILDTVEKNEYDFDKNLTKNESGLAIYKSGNTKSKSGINLDKNSGEVDFAKVKSAGIDFCMLRIGNRGDTSGVVGLDEKFVEYATNAKTGDLQIGVIFDSAAINEAEAVEEASFAVGAVGNFGVRYPIAINLCEDTKSTSSRDAKLTMKERTDIVKAFCDTVKQYNYSPVIKATRGTLISKLNLEDLNDYDIWVSDYVYPTDYPYKFTMWQYTNDVKLDGMDTRVPIDISFVDYSEK